MVRSLRKEDLVTRSVRASEAAGWCGGRLYGPDSDLCRVWRSDSREVAAGDAFVALRGAKTDGHLYLAQAVKQGAALVLLEESAVEKLDLSGPACAKVSFIAVPDSGAALTRIAEMYLAAVSPRVAGITGSVGKTTTRELSVAVLRKKYKVHSAIRSFNTIIGCSLTVLSMPPDTDILVLELGTNHFGEIREMVSHFPPDTAVITEVAPAHLEGFGSVEGVLRAKTEICQSPRLKCMVYNADNALLHSYMLTKRFMSSTAVGRAHDADLRAVSEKISLDAEGARFEAEFESRFGVVAASVSLFGLQHVYNVGYAIALGRYFSVPDGDIKAALAEFRPLGGRGVCKKMGASSWLIDEAYNANPSSLGAALDNVAAVCENGAKFDMYAVLGGMRELGKSSALWHERMLAKTSLFREVLLLGEEWAPLALPANAKLCSSLDDAAERVSQMDVSSGVLLVKGSNSYGLKKLVEALTGAAAK